MGSALLKWITSLGVGLLPGPRGTWGALLTWAAAMGWLLAGGGALCGVWFWTVAIALSALAVWSSEFAVRRGVFGESKDPGHIVIDEAAGMLLALYGVGQVGWWAIAAFLLFRFFDILKPLGVDMSQRLPGGWGIVVDDLLAGLYSLLVLRAAAYFFGWPSLS